MMTTMMTAMTTAIVIIMVIVVPVIATIARVARVVIVQTNIDAPIMTIVIQVHPWLHRSVVHSAGLHTTSMFCKGSGGQR